MQPRSAEFGRELDARFLEEHDTLLMTQRVSATSVESVLDSEPRNSLNAMPSMATAALALPVKLLQFGVWRARLRAVGAELRTWMSDDEYEYEDRPTTAGAPDVTLESQR
jgi:hypothetical protein